MKIKIAVVIDVNGTWSAFGWGDCRDKEILDLPTRETFVMNEALTDQELTDPVNRYWATVEIEIPDKPEIEEIEATVKKV